MTRLNCWEFKNCVRNLDGGNAVELGVCPAAVAKVFHGINGGRYCWGIAGTLCGGTVQERLRRSLWLV